jgi:tRNA (mo5U34)-methyltransferase
LLPFSSFSSTDQPRRSSPDKMSAREFIENSSFPWHQGFELVPGVHTPGRSLVPALLDKIYLPSLESRSVLDIGTFNGGLAFTLERLGAARIVALDIYEPDTLGFAQVKRFLDSAVEYVRGSVYDLRSVLGDEKFDLVFYWGVIYHLRNPLLSLDNVRSVVREDGTVYVESAVSDGELGKLASASVARFYRRDELGTDSTNWFAPSTVCLQEWCASAGLEPVATATWPEDNPSRAMITAEPTAGDPEFAEISFEVPLRAVPLSPATTDGP